MPDALPTPCGCTPVAPYPRPQPKAKRTRMPGRLERAGHPGIPCVFASSLWPPFGNPRSACQGVIEMVGHVRIKQCHTAQPCHQPHSLYCRQHGPPNRLEVWPCRGPRFVPGGTARNYLCCSIGFCMATPQYFAPQLHFVCSPRGCLAHNGPDWQLHRTSGEWRSHWGRLRLCSCVTPFFGSAPRQREQVSALKWGSFPSAYFKHRMQTDLERLLVTVV